MLMLIMLIAAVAGLGAMLLTDGGHVKELAEPVSCSECGRPTWSASGVCTKCRGPAPSAPPLPPPVMEEQPEALVPIMPALDAHGRIVEDLHCRQCGYNLRGLSTVGVCPECEMTISRSIFGDMLRFSDPQWVRRLHNGTWLLIIAIFSTVAGGILGGIAMVALGMAAGGGAPMTAIGLFSAVMTLFAFLWVAAVWMLTTPDPAKTETEPPVNARAIARWCIMASLLAVPLETFQQQGFAAGPAPGAVPVLTLQDVLVFLAALLLGLVALAGTAAGVVYLRSLALRLPSDSLAWQTKYAGWGYVVVSALGQLVGLAWLAVAVPMAAGAIGPLFFLLMAGSCVMTLGLLVFSIWMVVLLFRYAAAFGKAREGAERFAAAGEVVSSPQP